MYYDHWVASAKKLPWFVCLIAAGAILFDRSAAVVVVPAALGVFVAIFLVLRSGLSVGLFLISGWLSIACLLTCLSAMVIALARHEGLLGDSRIGWMALIAVVALLPIVTLYSSKVWKPRLARVQMEITGPECPKAFFFSLWTDPAQVRFWASPAALSAMTSVAIFGSWVAYRYGEGARAAVVISVLILAWVFLIGSGVAQLWHARSYREVLLIRLV